MMTHTLETAANWLVIGVTAVVAAPVLAFVFVVGLADSLAAKVTHS
jgi:hypothetical protein